MKKCIICKELSDESDLRHGICEDCLLDNATYENALKFGDDENRKETVQISGFVKSLLGEENINEILKDFVKLNTLLKDYKIAREFCLKDKYDFSEFLKKENE